MHTSIKKFGIDDTNWLWILLALTVFLNFSGLFITILGPDGALYASIAKSMVQRNNYVDLIAEGKDWLDKPHFPFWVTALSFRCFGFSTWAYKLPAILFLMMGAAYTYLLAKKLYNKRGIAIWSVIILLTAEHIIISNNDVRAEPYLTGLIIASLYHYYILYNEKKTLHLLWGSVFAACAVMTKGPFALIPIAAALVGHLLIKKKYHDLFNWQWLWAGILIFLFITPELYCLWMQFDSQPEKIVFGKTNVSGIRFFFWDSQFGRFLNTGPIKGKGDLLFFVHTLLWAFLPWSVLLYAAIVNIIKKNWRNPFWHPEWLSFWGALFTLLVFSLSRFQLPHYANIVFPFLSIMLAYYLHEIKSRKSWRFIIVTQTIIISLMLVAPLLIHYLFKPDQGSVFVIIILFLLLILLLFLNRLAPVSKEQLILYRTVLAALILNIYLNSHFYPPLMKYQAGSEAAFYCNNNYKGMPVVQLRKEYSYALEFYLDAPLITIDSIGSDPSLPATPFLYYLPESETSAVEGETIKSFSYFPVSRPDGKFINHKTRQATLRVYSIVSVK